MCLLCRDQLFASCHLLVVLGAKVFSFCLFNEGPESLRVCGEAFTYDVIDVAVVGFGYFFVDFFS